MFSRQGSAARRPIDLPFRPGARLREGRATGAFPAIPVAACMRTRRISQLPPAPWPHPPPPQANCPRPFPGWGPVFPGVARRRPSASAAEAGIRRGRQPGQECGKLRLAEPARLRRRMKLHGWGPLPALALRIVRSLSGMHASFRVRPLHRRRAFENFAPRTSHERTFATISSSLMPLQPRYGARRFGPNPEYLMVIPG